MKKFLFLLLIVLFVGCSGKDSGKVNYVKAKELMINNGAILVDVRTEEEYNEDHIEGAKLLTLDTISEDTAKSVIGDTDKYVILYCKSGKRSNEAYNLLMGLGYKNVYDLGAITNWKK